jgi:redox-sensing transcriptional repressor
MSILNSHAKVPIPTLERLATYLGYLMGLQAAGVVTISSTEIERQTGINAAQFRKDLSYFGEFGKPGVGYNVSDLQSRIAQILKTDRDQPVIVLGAGNLGSALMGYPGLRSHRFQVAAAFDADPAKIGQKLFDTPIRDIATLVEANKEIDAKIAILTLPARAAQTVADLALKAGITAFLNFAPTILKLPSEIVIRNVSYLQELSVLSYYLTIDEHVKE